MNRSSLSRLVPMLLVSGGLVVAAVSPALAGADHVRVAGPLVRYSDSVPAGANARVDAVYDAAGQSVISLHVWGMLPNHTYAGHALGLGHSDRPGAVMYPYYHLAAGLTDDDIAAIRDLYGSKSTTAAMPPAQPPAATSRTSRTRRSLRSIRRTRIR